ncbi:MAG: glycosyl hydrolase family 18 protein [Oscillospiraceae bacterium]
MLVCGRLFYTLQTESEPDRRGSEVSRAAGSARRIQPRVLGALNRRRTTKPHFARRAGKSPRGRTGVSGHASSAEQAKKAVQCMLAQGVAPGTICIGSPFYCTAMRLRESRSPYRPRLWRTGRAGTADGCGHACAERARVGVFAGRPAGTAPGDARAGGAYLVYDGPDNPFDRWFLSVETARSLGQKLDLIRNAELAGIIVWEASLDTKNHSFAAQLRDDINTETRWESYAVRPF